MRAVAMVALVLGLVGCTDRLATNTSVSKSRTYSKNVQAVTADQRCQDCHKEQKGQAFAGLGTHGFDASKKAIIKIMVKNNASSFLSAQQIKDVVDWVDAGAPDDSTPF